MVMLKHKLARYLRQLANKLEKEPMPLTMVGLSDLRLDDIVLVVRNADTEAPIDFTTIGQFESASVSYKIIKDET